MYGSTATASPDYLLWAYPPKMSPPCISRTWRVPIQLTFEQLHQVLQVAFGWTNSHAYSIEVNTIANKPSKRELRYGPDPTQVMTLQYER